MRRYWKGRKPLWKAFWLVWVVGSLVIPFTLVFIAMLVASFGANITLWELVAIWFIATFAYGIFSWTAVWRCAPRTQWKGWTYISKTLVLTSAGLWASIAVGGFFWESERFERVPLLMQNASPN